MNPMFSEKATKRSRRERKEIRSTGKSQNIYARELKRLDYEMKQKEFVVVEILEKSMV